ncbi:MAG: hypothetical protein HYZ83_05785 [Candidatus Omnitrophica bacterium]|nr:hypothetical protein [Candidatus Omnitrophota bacterium]
MSLLRSLRLLAMTKSFFVLFFLFVFSGCRIEFHAQSDVRDDGSIERTTTFFAQDKADREELSLRYELPADGVWKDAPLNVFKFLLKGPEVQMFSSYEAKQVISARNTPVTDFKRFTVAKDRAAFNQFSVRLKNFWFVKWFDYEEKYVDVIDPGKVKLVIEKVMEKGLTTFHGELSSRLQNPDLVKRIMPEIKAKYEGLLSRYYTLVSDKGWDFKGVEKLSQEIQKEFSSDAASNFLTEKFKELDNPKSRQHIADAFHATGTIMDEWLSQDKELQAYGQDIFGAHGFPIFQAYDFTVGVRLPGRVIQNNAAEKKGNTLVWHFTAEGLTQTLHARSRKIYPERIFAAALILVFLLFLLNHLVKKGDEGPKTKKKIKK